MSFKWKQSQKGEVRTARAEAESAGQEGDDASVGDFCPRRRRDTAALWCAPSVGIYNAGKTDYHSRPKRKSHHFLCLRAKSPLCFTISLHRLRNET